jgi:hypothetical protein
MTRCLAGCKKLYPSPVVRKRPLTRAEVRVIIDAYSGSLNYKDHLFTALLTVSFHGLFRLGELVQFFLLEPDYEIYDKTRGIGRSYHRRCCL